jgi:hypothetical protein
MTKRYRVQFVWPCVVLPGVCVCVCVHVAVGRSVWEAVDCDVCETVGLFKHLLHNAHA